MFFRLLKSATDLSEMRWMILLRRGNLLAVNQCYCRRFLSSSSNNPSNNAPDPFRMPPAEGVNPMVAPTMPEIDVQGDEFEKPRPGRMRAWQFHDYAGIDGLAMASNIRMPTLKSPTDVLVKVHAASVNPVDIKMLSKDFEENHRS